MKELIIMIMIIGIGLMAEHVTGISPQRSAAQRADPHADLAARGNDPSSEHRGRYVPPAKMKEIIKATFPDAPIMVHVAECESGLRHRTQNGTLVHNVRTDDVGVLQIHRPVHEAAARRAGIDLTTLQGNLAWGRRLYDQSGTRPWNASKRCWGRFASTG